MATVLTLHQGGQEAEFAEHPMEIARKALLEAAKVENDNWAAILLRVARALPPRDPIKREEA